MVDINLFDSTFVGQDCSVALQTPTTMRYVRNQLDWPGITVFVDGELYTPVVDDVRSRFTIGWLHEARALHPENYDRIGQVASKFHAIMTHDAVLLSQGAPFVTTIRGGSWVALDAWGMYPKSKHVSMILSDKRTLPGHQLRHAIAAAGLPIDLYGPSYTPIGYDKSLAYRDYRFAVVVEACQEDNFFSEHLLDALAYGCIPIYWGCPNIADYFNIPGYMAFRNVAELADLLRVCGSTTYGVAQSPLHIDQQRARAYAITEDWQIAHCLKPFVEALSC